MGPVRRYPNTSLLIVLLGMMVAHPILHAFDRPWARYVLDAIFFLVLLAALNAERGKLNWKSTALWFVILVAVMRTIVTVHPGELTPGGYRKFLVVTEVLTGLIILQICSVLLRNIWSVKRIRPDTIASSCAVYILIAFAFSSFYVAAWVGEPHDSAFNGVPDAWDESVRLEESTLQKWGQTFSYFSVVTQTTLGYGDISPNSPISRGLVMVQTLIGQLYIAILLALLVAIWLAQKSDDSQSP
ncbi:MAG: potassium channel family protein [Planctomycetota bacterium]